jgi:hypothetical protein
MDRITNYATICKSSSGGVFPIHEVKGLCERTEGLAMSQPLDVKMHS